MENIYKVRDLLSKDALGKPQFRISRDFAGLPSNTIAHVYLDLDNRKIGLNEQFEECRENAYLMAAARVMFEALETAKEALSGLPDKRSIEALDAIWTALRAARGLHP